MLRAPNLAMEESDIREALLQPGGNPDRPGPSKPEGEAAEERPESAVPEVPDRPPELEH